MKSAGSVLPVTVGIGARSLQLLPVPEKAKISPCAPEEAL